MRGRRKKKKKIRPASKEVERREGGEKNGNGFFLFLSSSPAKKKKASSLPLWRAYRESKSEEKKIGEIPSSPASKNKGRREFSSPSDLMCGLRGEEKKKKKRDRRTATPFRPEL